MIITVFLELAVFIAEAYGLGKYGVFSSYSKTPGSSGIGLFLWPWLASLRLTWPPSQAGLMLPAVALAASDKVQRQDWGVMGVWEFRQFLLVFVFQITPKCSSLKQQTFILLRFQSGCWPGLQSSEGLTGGWGTCSKVDPTHAGKLFLSAGASPYGTLHRAALVSSQPVTMAPRGCDPRAQEEALVPLTL